MNETTIALIAYAFGMVIGWVSFGVSVQEDCIKLNGFVAGSNAYVCEVKK